MPYTHLTENERYVISHLSIAGFTHREIARRPIGVEPSYPIDI